MIALVIFYLSPLLIADKVRLGLYQRHNSTITKYKVKPWLLTYYTHAVGVVIGAPCNVSRGGEGRCFKMAPPVYN